MCKFKGVTKIVLVHDLRITKILDMLDVQQILRFSNFYRVINESRKAKRFGRGLKQAIRSWISALKLQAYADVLERVLKIEKDIKEMLFTSVL